VSLPQGGNPNFPSVKVGLMARGSLGNGSAAVAVFFAANRGIHAFGRPLDGYNLGDERAGATPGLRQQAAVQVAKTPAPGGNWLLQPVWFKLVVNANSWTPYTSIDGGKTWQVAGAPQVLYFVGAWVGVFAASGNAKTVQAVFDNLSGFAPSTRVVIGTL
jgi:hypothetical protein